MQNSLCVPHVYDLPSAVTPGKTCLITIRIDNRIKEINIGPDSHSITDQTLLNRSYFVLSVRIETFGRKCNISFGGRGRLYVHAYQCFLIALMDETIALTKEYGNYASYCMLACGNEPSGRWVAWVSKFVFRISLNISKFFALLTPVYLRISLKFGNTHH